MMKPFGAGPKRRRSGAGLPPGPRAVSVLAKRSPAKRSPFKRRPLSTGVGASAIPSMAALDIGSIAGDQSCNIKVAVRVRPENEREMAGSSRNIIEVVDERMLVFDPKEDNDEFFFHGRKQERRDLNKKAQRDQKFAFDCVYGPNSTNSDVFEGTTKDLIEVVFSGFNCSVFVYGATGSGKTHTMLGKENNPGITLRTVVELYKHIETLDEDCSCEIMVSYLEIYNENVFDLINPGTQLTVREDGKSGVNIPGLSRHKPNGPEDLLKLLQFGNANRTQHPTDANKESSRSHAVFQVYIKLKSRSSGLSADMKVAKLSMIDLAGSERGSVTSSRGAVRFREGANINKSLLALGNCINALAEGSKYIPYRNSKLTRLLKDSIGGNCRTVMISNISPSSLTYEDTYNTLKYADRAKKIKIRLKKNVVSVDYHVAQYAKIVEDLKVEIQQLKNKIVSLEEENAALKNQVEDDDSPEPCLTKPSVATFEEFENLRLQLSEYETRQKEFDELKSKIDEFERDRVSALEHHFNLEPQSTTSEAVRDEKTSKLLDEHMDLMRKNFRHQSELNLIELQKNYHKRKFERCSAAVPTDTIDETGAKKLKKFVANLERKQIKSRKKNRQVALQYTSSLKALKDEGLVSKPGIKSEIEKLKTDLSNDHLRKMLNMMYDEQNRTEELLTNSLQQLKKSHLLLVSYGKGSEQMNTEYQDLINRIQCTRVQYRDSNLVETNEDTTSDRIGDFFAGLLDLEISTETPHAEPESKNLNETVVCESRPRTDIALLPIVEDEIDSEVFDEEEAVEEEVMVWRPPTPPRRLALNANKTPPSPKLSTAALHKNSVVAVEENSSSPKLPSHSATFVSAAVEPSACITSFNLSPAKPFSIHDYGLSEPKLTNFSELSNNFDASTNKTFFRLSADFQTKLSPLKEIPSTTLSYAQFVDIPLKLSAGKFLTETVAHAEKDGTSSMETSYVDENPAFDATIILGNSSAAPTRDFMPSSVPSTFNSTIILSSNESPLSFNSTITLPKNETPSPFNSTIVLTKNDENEDRRRTFLVPTSADNKENYSTSKKIATVSPMTSLVSSTYQAGAIPGGKAKKSLKKAFSNHPFASTSNLRSVLDFKSFGSKSSKEALKPTSSSNSTPTLPSTTAAPSYMQLTAASRIRAKGAATLPGAPPQRQRSRSPPERKIEHSLATVPAVDSGTLKTGAVPHRTLKKSYTTSNLRQFK